MRERRLAVVGLEHGSIVRLFRGSATDWKILPIMRRTPHYLDEKILERGLISFRTCFVSSVALLVRSGSMRSRDRCIRSRRFSIPPVYEIHAKRTRELVRNWFWRAVKVRPMLRLRAQELALSRIWVSEALRNRGDMQLRAQNASRASRGSVRCNSLSKSNPFSRM